MNKRYVFILIILLSINSMGFIAQDNSSLESTTDQSAGQIQNGIYLELGGNAGVYSINYERLFSLGKINIAGRMGFSFLSEALANSILSESTKKRALSSLPKIEPN